ncbi:ferric reductase NAD binding domain-containing protein [Auriculariales sp. MPI-PUGE-AT-0066]|nr:ferric reductase NAD binding domain-containing protein [Auriculariales sp. MPI-PUGE-AT-0066]
MLRNSQNEQFPLNLWLIILVVLSVLTLAHAAIVGIRRLRMYNVLHTQLDTPAEDGRRASMHTRFTMARFPLAAVNAWRIAMFRWTIPFTDATLADAILNLGYVGVVLLWTFVASRNASIALWASRSAAIAVCQVPLLPVLSSKNNFISFFTGISHEKMTSLHRAAGRSVVLMFWLHGAGKLYSGTPLTALSMQMGAASLGALTVTFFLSLGPIRRFFYEVFFVSHVLLISTFMITGWYHTAQVKVSFAPWMWAGMITWGFDRVFRLARVLYTIARRNRNGSSTRATIELVSEDTVRVYMNRRVSWKAGQHAFLTFPGISANPLEAHPFSIATIPDPPYAGPKSPGEGAQVSFIIRAKKGMTAKLKNQAAKAGPTGLQVSAVVDGPYGSPPDLTTYSTAVIIAGGSGITYAISMFENLIQKRRLGTSACRRVVLVWSIRDEVQIAWIYQQLIACLGCVPDNLSVSVRIYVTRGKDRAKSAPLANMYGRFDVALGSFDRNWTVKEKTTITTFRMVHIENGRPRIDSIIADEARSSLGAMSVDVCGPTSLVDRVRSATRASDIAGPMAIARGMPSITLHVESFSM